MVTGRPAMISNSSVKSPRCMGRIFGQRGAAAAFASGADHLAHGEDALAFEEHVLGAAKADAREHRSARAWRASLGRVGIDAHGKMAGFVSPFDQRGKVVR